MNLDIDKERNAEYFKIIEIEQNELMDRWNVLHQKLHELKIPKLFGLKSKKQFKIIATELRALQRDYLAWNKKASNFLSKPRYIFDNKKHDSSVAFFHYSSMLRHVLNTMYNNMLMIVESYNKRLDQYKSQLNFNIAIFSFVLTFLGLIVTLITVFY